MIFYKPIDSITEQDIQELIDTQIDAQKSERKTVEYKQAFPSGADNDKKEFLADVSAFANTAGGNVLFGIAERDGIPVKITGIKVADAVAYKLRLDSMIRARTAPSLPRLQLRQLPLD